MLIREDIDIGSVVIGDTFKRSDFMQQYLGETIDRLAALRRSQLGLLYRDLGLVQHTPEDVAGGHPLDIELPHDTQLDGMHDPKAVVGEVQDASIPAAITILNLGNARGQKDPKIDVSSEAHEVHIEAPKETTDNPPKDMSSELSSATSIAEKTINNVSCRTPIAVGRAELNSVSCTAPVASHMEILTNETVSCTPAVVEGQVEKVTGNTVSCTPPIEGQVETKTKNRVSCTTAVGEGETKNSVSCTHPVQSQVENQAKESVSCKPVVNLGQPPKETKNSVSCIQPGGSQVDNQAKDDVSFKPVVIHGHPPKDSKTKVIKTKQDNTKDDVISKTIVKCDGR